jgi:uncharacterized peroxidase-related enzyme
MSQYRVHTAETAPEESKPILDQVQQKYGFTPNLLGVLAEAPAAAKGYAVVAQAFEGSSLSPVEQQVVLLSVSFENECRYCMAAHSTVAGMVDMPEDVLEALRSGTKILSDPKLEALRATTRKLVGKRGWLEDSEVRAFLDAGYTKGQLLEILVGVAQKTISNYTNHLAKTPVDEQFAGQKWEAKEHGQPAAV